MNSFTHLHVASAFSAHHGTARPEALVQLAAETCTGDNATEKPRLALTDKNGLYGAIRHVRACISANVDPIVGVELQVVSPSGSRDPIVLLAHGHNDGAGWASLCRAISAAHSPRRATRPSHQPAPSITVATLASFVRANDGKDAGAADADTATVLLGPSSNVGTALANNNHRLARTYLQEWQHVFPTSLAVEIVCHFTEPGNAYSLDHAAAMLELADELNITAVLTNAVRYADPSEALTGDILDSADQLLPLSEFSPQPNGQAWLKPPTKMRAVAQLIVSASNLRNDTVNQLLRCTEALAEHCVLDPHTDLDWQRPKVPELSSIGLTGDPLQILVERCRSAVYERYPHASADFLTTIHDRLNEELATIHGFGFESYFLTVADVSSLIRSLGIRNQARGSGASSIVNYLLRVSSVDPLEHDLLFERFLGNRRSTLPDIDIDVESSRRHDIYRAIFDRYGENRTTLLSMQNKYRARGAARDAGLALGLEQEHINFVAKNIWRFNAKDFREVLSSKPELGPVAELAAQNPSIDMLIDLTERLDRLPRHVSMHPCGVILGNSDLLSYTPVQPSGMGLPMSQFDKDDIDDAGFIKLDVLGVRMQSAIGYAVAEIERIHGADAAAAGGLPGAADYFTGRGKLDIDAIPHDDEETFEAIRSTHTLGMFQIESPGQRELVGKMQPDVYSDLIADISLFRPGPMKGNMVKPFVEVKQGKRMPAVLHPTFTEFLADSYGVVIYHEHIIRILSACMGIDLAAADELRRRMESSHETIEQLFREQTLAHNLDKIRENADPATIFSDEDIDRIWEVVAGFGSFGFCKAHGAAFALPTYQTAWLKTHYPAPFLAGLFEHDPGMYPKRLLLAEARRMGIPLLPIDVNASSDQYRVEPLQVRVGRRAAHGDYGIRLSLAHIQGLTRAELDRLLEHQPYESIRDLHLRARPSRPLLNRLAAIGALDSLAPNANRGQIIAATRALAAAPRNKRAETSTELRINKSSQPPTDDALPNNRIPDENSIVREGIQLPDNSRVASSSVSRSEATGNSANGEDSEASDCNNNHQISQNPAPRAVGPDLGSHLDFDIWGDLSFAPAADVPVAERVRAELDALGHEISDHVIESYRPLLDQLGVIPAEQLLLLPDNSNVVVAGIRVATQTPPMRNNKRVVFISLDDGTGCSDSTFFEDAQNTAGPLLFGTRLMVIAGTTRRSGAKGVSIQATNAWDLTQLWATHTAAQPAVAHSSATTHSTAQASSYPDEQQEEFDYDIDPGYDEYAVA